MRESVEASYVSLPLLINMPTLMPVFVVVVDNKSPKIRDDSARRMFDEVKAISRRNVPAHRK